MKMEEVSVVLKNRLLCVIANDAAEGDEYRTQYTGIGPNYQRRVNEAVAWQEANIRYKDTSIWFFGAGTDIVHASGPTLAEHCRNYLKCLLPRATCRTNIRERNFYGTLEEIQWIVNTVVYQECAATEVDFVFFTQRRHMWRVRLIWRLFHQKQWGKATFVVTGHTKQLSILHEIGGLRKVWRIYRGKAKPRYETPYPIYGRNIIEC